MNECWHYLDAQLQDDENQAPPNTDTKHQIPPNTKHQIPQKNTKYQKKHQIHQKNTKHQIPNTIIAATTEMSQAWSQETQEGKKQRKY